MLAPPMAWRSTRPVARFCPGDAAKAAGLQAPWLRPRWLAKGRDREGLGPALLLVQGGLSPGEPPPKCFVLWGLPDSPCHTRFSWRETLDFWTFIRKEPGSTVDQLSLVNFFMHLCWALRMKGQKQALQLLEPTI